MTATPLPEHSLGVEGPGPAGPGQPLLEVVLVHQVRGGLIEAGRLQLGAHADSAPCPAPASGEPEAQLCSKQYQFRYCGEFTIFGDFERSNKTTHWCWALNFILRDVKMPTSSSKDNDLKCMSSQGKALELN